MTNNKNNENVRQEIAEIEAKFQSDLAAQEAQLKGENKVENDTGKYKYIIILVISVLVIVAIVVIFFNIIGKSIFNPNANLNNTNTSSGYFIPSQFIGDDIKSQGTIQIADQIDGTSRRYKHVLNDKDGNLVAYLESRNIDLSLSENLYVEISGLLSDQYNGVNVIRVESVIYK